MDLNILHNAVLFRSLTSSFYLLSLSFFLFNLAFLSHPFSSAFRLPLVFHVFLSVSVSLSLFITPPPLSLSVCVPLTHSLASYRFLSIVVFTRMSIYFLLKQSKVNINRAKLNKTTERALTTAIGSVFFNEL